MPDAVTHVLIRCLKLDCEVERLRHRVEELEVANELLSIELAASEQTNYQLALDMIRESGLQRRARAVV